MFRLVFRWFSSSSSSLSTSSLSSLVCLCRFLGACKFFMLKIVFSIMLLPSIGLRSLAPPLGTWFATSRAEKFPEHFPFCCSASTRSLHSFVSPMLFSLFFCSDLRSTYTCSSTAAACNGEKIHSISIYFSIFSLLSILMPPRFFCSRVTNESRVKKRLYTAQKMKNVEYTLYSLQSILGLADELTCLLSLVQVLKIHFPFIIIQVVNHELFPVCNARACCRVVNVAVVRPW